MTDALEDEIVSYLLGEMDAGRRAAFEARLERDPVARATLKSCADAMARFACQHAPAESLSALDQKAVLTAVLAEAGALEPPAPLATVTNMTRSWHRYFWPVAAAGLLTLNLIDFHRPLRTPLDGRSGDGHGMATAGDDAASEKGNVARKAGDLVPGVRPVMAASSDEVVTRQFMADFTETSRELAKLRAEHEDLKRAASALRAEHEEVVHAWTARVALDRTIGRLAAMELVDAESYARGDRKGLVEVARGILTEPGVIVAMDGSESPGGGRPGPAGGEPSAAPSGAAPYAWAVFDEREQRGYLNLYNVPAVGPDEALQLWVRPVDATAYRRVGEVPAAFYGGAGSVQYRMSDGAAPAEILITRESRNVLAEQPAGATVLRGP